MRGVVADLIPHQPGEQAVTPVGRLGEVGQQRRQGRIRVEQAAHPEQFVLDLFDLTVTLGGGQHDKRVLPAQRDENVVGR
ncbi:Uncharacterised protein [Mycobacteroides abscessus subsp. abscessus]|nr:Uncharacterised protein [Mycobacteroides abscessus subsp. abscessus]